MDKKFNEEFKPNVIYSLEERKDILSPYYIEVARECYHYDGLKNKKNDILVYSAILAGLNNEKSDTFSYTNTIIANRLGMNVREVRRATKNLEELKLIKIIHHDGNRRNIKVLKDLRYPSKGIGNRHKKSFNKIYDRIFFYPLITKSMVHIYGYYFSLTHNPDFSDPSGVSKVSYRKVSEALGYSEKHVIDTLKKMKSIGLVGIGHHKNNKNIKVVRLEVDFSQKQPEEIAYEKKLENSSEEWIWEGIPKHTYTIEDEDLVW